MQFVKVKITEGETARKKLTAIRCLETSYEIVKKDGFIFFPIKKAVEGFDIVVMRGQKVLLKKPKKLEDALDGLLSRKEIKSLTTSFDIIGDIAIIEIPPGLESKEREIATALMKVHPVVKVVAKKLGGMEGEFRVRPLKVIAGEHRTETEYKESSCRIKLDVATVYFSVRLSHERERIAVQVKDGEKILALFAGVGPFPLVISKLNKGKRLKIAAIELNPDAVKYMRENIKLNGFIDIVEPILGDARSVVLEQFQNWADRVLMPLPRSAEDFLDVAFAGVKDGGMIHFYTFAKEEIAFEEAEQKIRKKADEAGVSFEIISQRVVRPFAPRIVQVVTDFIVRK